MSRHASHCDGQDRLACAYRPKSRDIEPVEVDTFRLIKNEIQAHADVVVCQKAVEVIDGIGRVPFCEVAKILRARPGNPSGHEGNADVFSVCEGGHNAVLLVLQLRLLY